MVEMEQADYHRLCIRYKHSRVVAFVAVAFQIIHLAMQSLRNPVVHELRVIVQTMYGSYAAGIEAHL
jgi:hypothetical protein